MSDQEKTLEVKATTMKNLVRNIVYKWSRSDGGDISEDEKDSLDLIAMRVIYSSIGDGRSEGKLNYQFSSTDKSFYGFWYFSKETHYKAYLPEWAKNNQDAIGE